MFTRARHRMVQLLRSRGIEDPKLLQAFLEVPRDAFVPEALANAAYDDLPLPIGDGQTISQPLIVAITIQALKLSGGATERVLEVGTGSGYAAAVLSKVAGEVFTIERRARLAEQAKARLEALGYRNVQVRQGDGTLGWPEAAPFDAIAVSAGGPKVPTALTDQLAPGGRLVIPVGPDDTNQTLVRLTRLSNGQLLREDLLAVRFVPLIGEQGWEGA